MLHYIYPEATIDGPSYKDIQEAETLQITGPRSFGGDVLSVGGKVIINDVLFTVEKITEIDSDTICVDFIKA